MYTIVKNMFDKIFLEHGIRNTKARQAILKVVVNSPKTVDEIKSALEGVVHQATVYRSLEEFLTHGILTRIDSPRGFLYELSTHHHHHVVCGSCGTIEKVSVCIPQSAARAVLTQSKHFGTLTGHTLEFSGICKKCSS